MKKLIAFILMGIFLTTGCQPQKEMEVPKKNVKVIQAETRKYPLVLDYIGMVDSQDVRTPGFKTGGKIEEIFVKSGQRVSKGEKLVRLNEEDLKNNVEVTKAQYEIAKSQYKTSAEIAERNYLYTKDIYEKNEKLLEAGAISSQQLEDIRQELIINEAKKEEIEILKNQIDIAYASYLQSQDLLENSVLRSEVDGTVVQISAKEGDYIAQGMPVVAVKGKDSSVKVGVTNEDVSKIYLGMGVAVKYQKDEIKGSVETVSSIPGDQSSLYEVKISLEPNNIPIGTLVDVSFNLGEIQGLFVPMNSLLNESFDFVYIVENEKAVMKEVVLGEVLGSEIEIKEGITPGDKVIVEGVKSIKNGDRVDIKE
ncbi:RND family efflux transporter MFP subunit [Anaerosolibacter carboniphilus]|uniref:RND family efflux transporter MFP subunit n=1 Tax=Anaerosolibacter carboniphilus TaxID=1417629 RepID=A0A841KK10_9FIRM|nr:efflux RND transporter periplasmic adaptor subunit [Anaerosolibacter carboniphilus]MBB6214204.1 RND family efflux transporter MFP subunit [Anaerosolibacter carboniphilus]